jgi:phytoene dehydrogenase-like protein
MALTIDPPTLPQEVDGIFVGGGHNSLVAANYMARAGLSVLVLEGDAKLGGGGRTEEATLPLFRHNIHAYFVRWTADDRVWDDLDLSRYGARTLHPEVQAGQPYDDGRRGLVLYRDVARSLAAIARIDAEDARAYEQLYREFVQLTTRIIAPLRYVPPLDPDEETELLARSALGRRYLELVERSPVDVVTAAFRSEPVRALVLFGVAVRGYIPNLDVPGTGDIVALALPAGHEVRIIEGGTGTMVTALARALYEAGGRMAARSPVASIDVRGGRAAGVTTTDGRSVRARRFVASSVPAPLTLLELVGREHLDPEVVRELEGYRWLEEALFGVHFALSRRPRFACEDEDPDLPHAVNLGLGYESTEDLLRDTRAIREREVPPASALHASIPTVHDPSQAPPGFHTSFGWQFVPPEPGGREGYWDDPVARSAQTKSMVDAYARYAPDLHDCLLDVATHSPADTYALVPSMYLGDRQHGSYHPSNKRARRSHFVTPVDGLYLCGASQHPGGSFHGIPAFVAAGVIADDLGVPTWWPRTDARSILAALS